MVAETVHDQAGQQIALAVAQAVPGLVVEALAQAQGALQTLAQQVRVQGQVGLAAVETGADERMRVDEDAAQHGPARVAQGGVLAGLKVGQGTFGAVYLVAENPQVAGTDAAVFPFFQPKCLHGNSRWAKKFGSAGRRHPVRCRTDDYG